MKKVNVKWLVVLLTKFLYKNLKKVYLYSISPSKYFQKHSEVRIRSAHKLKYYFSFHIKIFYNKKIFTL